MSDHYPEFSALLSAIQFGQDGCAEMDFTDLDSEFDWTFLVQTALQHGVSGLLCQGLLAQDRELIPAEIIDAAQAHLDQSREANQKSIEQFLHIHGKLREEGIEVIPFKGPALALNSYADLSLRSFRDLDFLIRKDQIEPCLKRLASLGYVNEHNLSPRQWHSFVDYSGQDILFGDGLPLEPHWAFTPSTLAVEFDYVNIWEHSVQTEIDDRSIRVLAPEDELIMLVVHGCKEKWHKLKWVVDVAAFIHSHGGLDWDMVVSRAKASGMLRMLGIGLMLAEKMMCAQIPQDVTKLVKLDHKANNLSSQICSSYFVNDTELTSVYGFSSLHWQMRERLRDRVKYAWRTATTPRAQHFQDISIPDSMFYLYTPYKILHDYLAFPAWIKAKQFIGFFSGETAAKHSGKT